MTEKEIKALKELKAKEAAEIAKAAKAKEAAKVEKMLSPEEQTILGNIKSLVGELLSPTMGGGEEEEVIMQKQEDEKKKVPEKDDEVDKGIETTQSDSSTASDDDEERIDETQTELTEKSVDEVAKMLRKMFKLSDSKKIVAKSEMGQLVDAIKGLVDVQKGHDGRVSDIETALGSIIEGLGIAKQMEVSKSVEGKKPVVTSDNEKVFKAIAEVLGKAVGENVEEKPESNQFTGNSQVIRKTLRSPGFLQAAIANKM